MLEAPSQPQADWSSGGQVHDVEVPVVMVGTFTWFGVS